MSLIEKLGRMLQGSKPSEAKTRQYALQLANAVLLVEISRADFSIDRKELEAACTRLARRYDLTTDEAETLLADAVAEQRQSASMHEYLVLLNKYMSSAEKVQLIEDLWFIAYADGSLDPYEESQIRKVAELMYVSHAHFIRGRYRVSKD